MSTINDLSATSTVSDADQLPIWQTANGVTRRLPVSVLDGRYVTQANISLLAISPTPEIFSAGDGIAPNTFVPGVSLSLTLANLYYSAGNIEVFFDGTFQGSDQYSLTGYGLAFLSPIPLGTSKVYIRGGSARLIGAPGDGTVTDSSIAAGSSLSYMLPNRVVGSVAAMQALNIAKFQLCWTTAFYPGGAGAAGYYYDPAFPHASANSCTAIISLTGAGCWRMIPCGVLSALQCGAKGDGLGGDDTVAFQNGIGTGLPFYIPHTPFSYHIKDAITCRFNGQLIVGDGKNSSFISVDSTFNLAAAGVFVFACGEPGPVLKDFCITFSQPDTNIRANLTLYPPAIEASNTPRFELHEMKIQNAMIAIDCLGNSGGAKIIGCDICSFTFGIRIDGSLDTITIDRLHHYPFGLGANLLAIFQDAGTYGIITGRMDDLKVTTSMFFSGTAFAAQIGVSGGTSAHFTACAFDTGCNIQNAGGDLNFSACGFSCGISTAVGYTQNGTTTLPSATFSACDFVIGALIGAPIMNFFTGTAQITGCTYKMAFFDIAAIAVNGAAVTAVGNFFDRTGGLAYTQPTIETFGTASRLTAHANRTNDKGTGAGTFINVSNDNFHNIVGNTAVGWAYTLPTLTLGVAGLNN